MKLKRTALPVRVGLGALPGCKTDPPTDPPVAATDKPIAASDAGSKPKIIIRENEPIPQRLGGAAAPYPPPPPPPPKGRGAAAPAGAAPAAAPAPAAAAAPAP